MKSVKLDGQRGQILVQVAIMVGVLFAFVALAVDGGQVYAGRRRMQNAADAGALAAAREICFGDDGSLEGAEAAGWDYAVERNDAQDARVDFLHPGGYTVTVVASQTLDTFFAGVIGINTAVVRGEAAATCGKVTTLCSVWPIGFDADTFSKTKDSCGQHVLLWEDGKAQCDEWICNCNPELGDLPTVADGRTWIDFSAITPGGYDDPCDQTGCGSSELSARIRGETKNKGEACLSYVQLDSCTAGNSGLKSQSWDEAGDQGQLDPKPIKFIPIYDPGRSSPLNPCSMTADPGDACGTERFFITDVACVRVHGACRLCEEDYDPTKKCNGPKVIDVEILCEGDPGSEECSSSCGTSVGGIPEPGDVKAVNLIPFPYE